MERKLQTYALTLTTVGPVFIGNGKEISKKEYFRLKDGTVVILNIEKFYAFIEKKHLEKEYLKFMLGNNKAALGNWMREVGISMKDISDCVKYKLKNSDMVLEQGARIQIMEHIKDPYGLPYIPGSSVKGMLRTILLCHDIFENPQKYEHIRTDMERELFSNRNGNTPRKAVLAKSIQNMEVECYHSLKKIEKDKRNAVNSILSGLIVSDSKPLQIEDLTLCQKIEVHPDGTEHKLNLLRECIKPGTKLEMTLTIDESRCSLNHNKIMGAVEHFNEIYNENFIKKFKETSSGNENIVYLGGGAGFVSKTIIYALFQGSEGIKACQSIFEKTKVPRDHKHYKDMQYGVSPHILKSTYYLGKRYQIGQCICEISKKG